MDWKQFFSSVISSLCWPIAAVLIVGLLRTSLMGLLPKIRSFKYGDLHIDLGKELEAVKAEISVQDAESSPPVAPPPPPAPTTVELAALSPRSAVLVSWLEVEKEIEQALLNHNINLVTSFKASPAFKMNVLRDKQIVDDHTVSTFKKLLDLRNHSVHLTEVDIGYSDAITMAELCEWLIQKLKEA